MSVTSASDPVKTIIDLLDNTAAGDWDQGGSTPDRIERSEVSDPSEKMRDARLTEVSLYVFSPVESDLRKFDAEGNIDQTERVQVDIFAEPASTTNNYASDVVDIINDYTNDNSSKTVWTDIWPENVDDQSAHGFQTMSFTPISVQIRLRRYADN